MKCLWRILNDFFFVQSVVSLSDMSFLLFTNDIFLLCNYFVNIIYETEYNGSLSRDISCHFKVIIECFFLIQVGNERRYRWFPKRSVVSK